MLCADLEKFGFNTWQKINAGDTQPSISRLPREWGVYIIGMAQPLKRLMGESDVLYIGQTKDEGGLYKRVNIDLLGEGKHTAKADLKRVRQELKLELKIFWKVTKDPEDPEELETELLRIYRKDHIELPPLNHTRPKD
jgi:hypothetical protein